MTRKVWPARGAYVASAVAAVASTTSMLCRMKMRVMPILSRPANRIAGKNKMPTSFDAVASPIATPVNPANLQLLASAHRHPRYRARVEKNARNTSRIASRPIDKVRGETTHNASARTPVQ